MMEVAAIILAAGRSSRFGAAEGESKVLADVRGRPMIRHVVDTALASRARPILVITGNAASAVAAAFAGCPVMLVANPDWSTGIASSLKVGVGALPPRVDGALILLGDMPFVTSVSLDRLIATFESCPDAPAIVPRHQGRRGNPVLIGRSLFDTVANLSGDAGARTILAKHDGAIAFCDVDDPGIAIDVDTRETLEALSGSKS